MDRNKSVYKLKNFGPIYYLNLDGQPERMQYMEEQFKYWEIENYERISAYDGREDDLSDIIKGKYPDMMTSVRLDALLLTSRQSSIGWRLLRVLMQLLWRMIVI